MNFPTVLSNPGAGTRGPGAKPLRRAAEEALVRGSISLAIFVFGWGVPYSYLHHISGYWLDPAPIVPIAFFFCKLVGGLYGAMSIWTLGTGFATELSRDRCGDSVASHGSFSTFKVSMVLAMEAGLISCVGRMAVFSSFEAQVEFDCWLVVLSAACLILSISMLRWGRLWWKLACLFLCVIPAFYICWAAADYWHLQFK